MAMTATILPVEVEPLVNPNAVQAAFDGYRVDSDDRLDRPTTEVRSAWACPTFYLAIPVFAIIAIAVVMIRLYDTISTAVEKAPE